MEIKVNMSNNFKDYAIANVLNGIKAIDVIRELTKNKDIKRPKKLKLKETSIADLKYKNKNFKECSINIFEGYFKIVC